MTTLEDQLYDPYCDRKDVAVRALWLLFLRGKWGLLKEVGLTSQKHNAQLTTASDFFGPKLSPSGVSRLLEFCPALNQASEDLLFLYRSITLSPSEVRVAKLLGDIYRAKS